MKRVLIAAGVAALLAIGGLAGCVDTTATPHAAASTVSTQSGGTPESTGTTSAGPTSTTTTLAPGAMTFDTLIERFESLVNRENLGGTLPFSVMSEEDLAWLFDAAIPFTVTEAQGYRFANGDLVLVFFLIPPRSGADAGPGSAAAKEFAQLAHARFGDDDNGVWPYSDEQYGYVVVSKQYREDLGRLAQWARNAHQLLIPE